VRVDELPEDKIQSILQKYSTYTRVTHQIQIEPKALELSYRLLLRYFPYESFPGKAIKFLGKCLSDAKLAKKNLITVADITQHFIQQTGLPELLVNDQKKLDEEELYRFFSSRILGQPRAVQQLCSLVKIFKAGINNPNRPIATLVFAGPTGVGKTASAKALADYFFGHGQSRTPLIRIDMSEYQHPAQLGKLFGFGAEPGVLVKEIREKPFAVLLLDEIEKADSSVFDALLAVLDEGILMDAYGRVTYFKNTIIIMTSNLGASNRQRIGFQETTSDENRYLSAMAAHFRPEFVNRIDGVVIFDSLFENDIRNLAKKELEELGKREGFTKRALQLEFTDRVIDYLTAIGFDERYGARPLQRAIDQSITSSIARWLLENPTAHGLILKIDYNGILIITVGETVD
jgi:ATP-dependent Clp protease ATP-binding subunit ClpA